MTESIANFKGTNGKKVGNQRPSCSSAPEIRLLF